MQKNHYKGYSLWGVSLYIHIWWCDDGSSRAGSGGGWRDNFCAVKGTGAWNVVGRWCVVKTPNYRHRHATWYTGGDFGWRANGSLSGLILIKKLLTKVTFAQCRVRRVEGWNWETSNRRAHFRQLCCAVQIEETHQLHRVWPNYHHPLFQAPE